MITKVTKTVYTATPSGLRTEIRTESEDGQHVYHIVRSEIPWWHFVIYLLTALTMLAFVLRPDLFLGS